MADYTFQPRFVLPIELGLKQQTIRRYKTHLLGGDGLKGHAKVGGPIGLKTGPRFRPRYIGHATAVLVDHVLLEFAHGRRTLFGHMGTDIATAAADLDRFAVLDGFGDWHDMRAFWRVTHEVDTFQGARIFWGDTFKGPLDHPPGHLAGPQLPQEIEP